MESSRPTAEIIHKRDEITLKDLIIKSQELLGYLLRKWWLIALVGIVGGGLGIAYALSKKVNYAAELTFVMEESNSSPLGGYAKLASQFGMDLGGGNAGGVFTNDNIIAFLKSRLMVEKTLLSSVTVNNQEISLADLYISSYKLRDGWKELPELNTLSYKSNEARSGFSLKKDSVLGTIFQSIVKGNLEVDKPDKKANFIAVTCISPNEIFSKLFAERLVREVTDFYIETKTKRTKGNVDKLEAKADSIEVLLNRKTYSAAVAQDLNLNPAKRVAMVNTELVTRDKVLLQTMYAEVIKNLEISRMAMVQETPLIQVIDTPILPLKKISLGKAKGGVVGFIAGCFLVIFVLVSRRLYKDVMR